MSPPIDLGDRPAARGPDRALQRALLAPVLAAATVALCGLVTDRGVLREGSTVRLVLLFACVAAAASFAAGLFAGRRSLVVALAVAGASTATAAVLVVRLAKLRAADPALPAIDPLLAAALLAAGAVAGVLFAAVGARLRPRGLG